ncbi:MAG: hypothetical protein K2X66_05735 [Cyanobacteria bacterium]|nr:hypothetical protein [Cyanobacteriota bacterium]
MKKPFYYYLSGQSLSEYAMPIALVSVLAIASLGLLGQQVSNQFNQSITKAPPRVTPIGFAGSSVNEAMLQALPGQFYQIALSNGKTLSFRYTNPAAVAESVGSNGVTDKAALEMLRLAKELRNAGELDQTQFQGLVDLANKGHAMAQTQKQVDTLLPNQSLGDSASRLAFLKNTTLPQNGGGSKTLFETLSNLSLISNNGSSPVWDENYTYNWNIQDRINDFYNSYDWQVEQATKLKNSNFNFNSPLVGFMNQLKAVEASGALKNPAVNALIKNVFAPEIFKSVNNSITVDTKQELAERYQSTQANSNNICTLSQSIQCKKS